ncbi:MAG: MarR family transcriptional regulator [Syntrophobacterales bacterium]|nr:MarR family transcriptional regulator [Syntrophobacterales bacterium]
MTKQEAFINIGETFNRIINKFTSIEKKPRDFGTGDLLYPSEIHNIEIIGRNPGINVTNLAKKLGVTKGAVSQTVNKLERKNLVEKFRNSDNEKEVMLKLQKKGEIAFNGHEAFHAKFYSEITDEVDDMTSEQIQFFQSILAKIDKYVTTYMRS